MKVLVTGAAGFIGSHVCDTLLAMGHSVAGLDNFDKFYSKQVKLSNLESALVHENYSFFEADITKREELNSVFRTFQPERVIHLAAKAGVRPSIENPASYFETNLMGTLNLLETMLLFNVNKLVFASSSSVYGNNKSIPFSETDMVDCPISPYAASKKSAELLCHNYHHLYGFSIYALRFFTVFGPRQRPDLAIHKFTDNILNGKPIDIFGDGSTSRDYTFIDDIVSGIISSVTTVEGYQVLNLGNSYPITLKHMVETIENELGIKAIKNILPMQEGDVNITYADTSKAAKLFGYAPKHSFEEGIRKFVDWKCKSYSQVNI